MARVFDSRVSSCSGHRPVRLVLSSRHREGKDMGNPQSPGKVPANLVKYSGLCTMECGDLPDLSMIQFGEVLWNEKTG